MAHLIFRLRHVPDDEAEEIRQLLNNAHIDFYETDAGNWGISMPGLWLSDPEDSERAKTLIDDYQLKRAQRMRLKAESDAASGQARTLSSAFRERPLYTAGLLVFCVALIYFMTKPFIGFISR
ncbi:MAG: hypothetical protein KTR32_21685 [Granulosicoccus sp.]|nr:hypothetical protein [Granulosicoccus sp.]